MPLEPSDLAATSRQVFDTLRSADALDVPITVDMLVVMTGLDALALAIALNDLERLGLVQVETALPPGSTVLLTPKGLAMARAKK